MSEIHCREPDRTDVFRKETQNQLKQTFNLKFRLLRAYFEEEAATSTTSVIHQWKALVKPEFWSPLSDFCHQYLTFATRPIEILVPKQEYRVRQVRNVLSVCAVSAPSSGRNRFPIHSYVSLFFCMFVVLCTNPLPVSLLHVRGFVHEPLACQRKVDSGDHDSGTLESQNGIRGSGGAAGDRRGGLGSHYAGKRSLGCSVPRVAPAGRRHYRVPAERCASPSARAHARTYPAPTDARVHVPHVWCWETLTRVLGLAAADEAVDANKSGGSGVDPLQPAGNHWLDAFAGANRGRVARPRQGSPQLHAQTETALWSQKRPFKDYVRKQLRRLKKKMNVQAHQAEAASEPPAFKEYIHKQLSRWKSKSEHQVRPRAASAPPAFKEYIHKQLSRWKSRLHKKQAGADEHNINKLIKKREMKGGRSKSEHQAHPQATSAPFGVARWDANGDPIAEVRPKRIGLKTAGIDTDSWAGRDFTDVAGRHHTVPSIW
jgi:hypothetical protein